MSKIILNIFFHLCFVAYSQRSFSERTFIETLSSKDFWGRGYEFSGHLKAADFLERELKKLELSPLGSSYFQYFNLETVLFEKTPFLLVNEKELKVGKDYLPYPFSGSGEKRKCVPSEVLDIRDGIYIPNVHKDYNLKRITGKIIIINEVVEKTYLDKEKTLLQKRLKYLETYHPKAVLIRKRTSSFTYYKSSWCFSFPIFEVKEKFLNNIQLISYSVFSEKREIQTQNIIGLMEGSGRTDSLIVFTAHYDHLGSVGRNVFFPGANDNASGVVMVLSLLHSLKKKKLPYNIVCIFFSGEEAGLLGSKFFVKQPLIKLEKIKILFNFDMVASGKDEMVILGGVEFPNFFKRIKEVSSRVNKHIVVRPRENAPNSDHYYFLQRGIPSFFIYMNKGKQPYHQIEDIPKTLEWDDFTYIKSTMLLFLEGLEF